MTGSQDATASAAIVTRRKLRVLAVHGGYSNSNIMKFQLAQLRKTLGKDVDWLLPDAMIPQHPYAAIPEHNLFPEVSALEARLAQGKPLVSWYVLRITDTQAVITEPDTWNLACASLLQFIEKEEPIDLAVGFSQGALMIIFIALRLKRAGSPVPWQLAVFFCPSDPTKEICSREFVEFLSFPVLHITSPGDPHYSLAQQSYARLFPPHLRTSVEHEDGYTFPITQPRATEIYQLIAQEVKKHCGASAGGPPAGKSVQPVAVTGAQADHLDDGKQEESSLNPATEGKIAPVGPEELAKLLLAGTCLVVDTRQPETRGSRPFPGCDLKDDLSFAALQRNSKDTQRRLMHLQRDGRQVVAVSRLGELDREYCELLVGSSGLPAQRVRWLAGGLRAWASWEMDRAAAAAQVRLAAGLPARREAGAASVGPAELAEMLREGRCAVADAREAAESRGRAFPGACKGISFLTLQRRPDEAAVRLARLREQGGPVVVISVTGGRCRQYCAMLIDHFGFNEDSVCRLDGGLRSWVAWEMENQEASEDIRRQYGLPRARCRLASQPDDSSGAAERDLSVETLGLYS